MVAPCVLLHTRGQRGATWCCTSARQLPEVHSASEATRTAKARSATTSTDRNQQPRSLAGGRADAPPGRAFGDEPGPDPAHGDLVPDDFATRRRHHGRRVVALVVAATVAGPALVAGAVAASVRDDAGRQDDGAEAIESPGTPTGPVTPQFPPVSPAPTAFPPRPDPTPSGATPTPIAPRASPTAPDLPHAEPVRIDVPDLGITSELVRLGLNDDGSLEVPEDFDLAGWYADGPAPGDVEAPPAVIVGHVDSTTGPAVFYRLRELVAGQEVHVTREDGSVAVFRVRDTVQYPKSALPADEVYARRSPSELVLITCSGAFDEVARSYLDNFVVTARLDRDASSTVP